MYGVFTTSSEIVIFSSEFYVSEKIALNWVCLYKIEIRINWRTSDKQVTKERHLFLWQTKRIRLVTTLFLFFSAVSNIWLDGTF